MSENNRIKKCRNITVDDIKYVWMDDGFLKIWKDKKLVFHDKVKTETSGLLQGLRPGIVAEIIKNLK